MLIGIQRMLDIASRGPLAPVRRLALARPVGTTEDDDRASTCAR
ncbi:MAG: hypothetical protein WKF83_15990 [Nocardioidaceae bacterium]